MQNNNVKKNFVTLAPGVGSAYKNGWRQLFSKYFLGLFLILIIGFIIGIPSGMSGWTQDTAATGILGLLAFIYGILIEGPVQYGVAFAFLKAARVDKLETKDMFAAFKNYWNAVLASFLVGVIIVIGLVLLIANLFLLMGYPVQYAILPESRRLQPEYGHQRSYPSPADHQPVRGGFSGQGR